MTVADAEILEAEFQLRALLTVVDVTKVQALEWVSRGLIAVADTNPGPGNRRDYSFENLVEAAMVAQLVRVFDLRTIEIAMEKIRKLRDRERPRLTASILKDGQPDGTAFEFAVVPTSIRVTDGDNRTREIADVAVHLINARFAQLQRTHFPGPPLTVVLNASAIVVETLNKVRLSL